MVSIQYLNYFLKVCETCNLSQAAKQLFISQPTLSLAMKNLEAELGVELFKRSNRGIEISADGRRLMKHCELLMRQLSLIESIAEQEHKQRLSVVSFPFLVFPSVLTQLRRKPEFAELQLDYQECRTDPALLHVEQNKAEIGVIQYNSRQSAVLQKKIREKNLEMTEIGSYPWAIAMGPKNPYYDSDDVTMEQVAQFRHIRLLDDYFATYTGEQRVGGVLMHDLKYDFVESSVMAGHLLRETDELLFGCVQKWFLDEYRVRLKPIRDADISITVGWVHKAGKRLSAEAEAFLEILEESWR